MTMSGVRRSLATLLLALAVAVGVTAVPGPALAAEDTTTTSAVPTRDIIPRPNVGAEPTDAGDRGGGLQSGLFFAIVIVIVGAGAYLVVQSRRARADRGF